MVVLVIFGSLIFLLLLKLTKYKEKDAYLPPHPPLSPILGNLPLIAKMASKEPMIREVFRRLSSKLGDIFRLKLGNEWLYVITGYDALKVKKIYLEDQKKQNSLNK